MPVVRTDSPDTKHPSVIAWVFACTRRRLTMRVPLPEARTSHQVRCPLAWRANCTKPRGSGHHSPSGCPIGPTIDGRRLPDLCPFEPLEPPETGCGRALTTPFRDL